MTSFRFLFFIAGLASIVRVSAQCEVLVWSDEFSGVTLDPDKWTYDLGDGCPSLCGWGNGELQTYTNSAANIFVSGGTLKIRALSGGGSYTSARIATRGKFAFNTGKIEARLRVPAGQGLWPAFWMLPENYDYGNWPLSGEMDIMEIKGQEPARTYGTVHYGASPPENQYTGTTYDLPSASFADAFHVFTLEWTTDVLVWFVDGVPFQTLTPTDLGSFPWRYDRDFHLLLNLAVGGGFAGNPDGTTPFPATYEIDYVRVYQDLNNVAIGGRDIVMEETQGLSYKVAAIPLTTYSWSLPSGMTLQSGAGTRSITADAGTGGSPLQVTLDRSGCNRTISYDLDLADGCEPVLLDFNGTRRAFWFGDNGTLQENFPNPAPGGVNPSTFCARYDRGAGLYDVLNYSGDAIGDAADFRSGLRRFRMDVYSTAPAGREILLQLERQNQSSSQPFPAGRHSVYRALTTVSGAWQRLTFTLNSSPDFSVANEGINAIAVLFDPGNPSPSTWYFDNLVAEQVPCSPACDASLAPNGLAANPVASGMKLAWNPLPESVACQVKGGPSGGGEATRNVTGAAPAQTVIPNSQLIPGALYNWRVRCACSVSPPDLSPFSASSAFTVPALRTADEGPWEVYDGLGRKLGTLPDSGAALDPGSYILRQPSTGETLQRVILP